MKVKVYVVDLELPPRTKRWALRIGLPVAVILGGLTIAYAAPKTWGMNEPLKSADLNAAFTDLDKRIAALETATTEWRPYTPVFSRDGGTLLGNHTTTGRYRRVGDSMELRIRTTFAANPSSGAAWWQWSIPMDYTIDTSKTIGAAGALVGSGYAQEGIGNNVMLSAYVRSTTTISGTANGAGTYYISDAVPFTWKNGTIEFCLTVPIAGWTAKGGT